MTVRRLHGGALAALSLSLLFGCGDDDEAGEPEDTSPILGLFDQPISLHNDGSEPSEAFRLEISQSQLKLDGHEVVTLSRGRLEDSAVADHIVTELRTSLSAAPARRRARVQVQNNVPYITLVRVLNTLDAVGVNEVHFGVRTIDSTPAQGWMPIQGFHVVAADAEPEWSSDPVSWDAFGQHWRETYEACRAPGPQTYIDCDPPFPNIAQGGDLQVVLWTRGQGMKVTFRQVNPPEPEAESGGGGARLIEGVGPGPAIQTADDLEAAPATEGAFNIRFQNSVVEDSAISATLATPCGGETCHVLVTTDATTPSMRVLSFLGAIAPNGATQPEIAFQIPED